MNDRPLIPSAVSKQIEDWEMWKIQTWKEIGHEEGFQAGLKKAAEIRSLVQEARDTIHACNRQIITQEVRMETRSLLDRALKIIDGE